MDEKALLEAIRAIVQEENKAIKADIAHLNHTIEPQLKIIHEGVQGLQEHYKKLDKVEAKQEEHDHRIFALEQLAKAK